MPRSSLNRRKLDVNVRQLAGLRGILLFPTPAGKPGFANRVLRAGFSDVSIFLFAARDFTGTTYNSRNTSNYGIIKEPPRHWVRWGGLGKHWTDTIRQKLWIKLCAPPKSGTY